MKKLALSITLEGLTLCNPFLIEKDSALTIESGNFSNLLFKKKRFNAENFTAYPGLINAHDHLLGTYLPKVGNGPYLSWKPWDDDLKASKLYKERSKLTNQEIYTLAYYRQILSGVTTVCDHIPHKVNQNFIPSALVRIIDQYCLAHEISSYELKWGDSHEAEIARAKEKNIPFITHIEEGFDNESKRGIAILNAIGGICHNAVLVHCINCSNPDINLIAQKKASIVWCPNSNLFMFQKTAPIKNFFKYGVNVCLGTDSPMSGSPSLIKEMQFATKVYQSLYNEHLSAELLLRMTTTNPVKAFKLSPKLGSLKIGNVADFLLLKNFHHDPYDQLVSSSIKDLFLVARQGVPLYFREEILHSILHNKDQLQLLKQNYQKVSLIDNGTTSSGYLIGQPNDFKKKIDKKIGFPKFLSFFPLKTL